MKQVFITTSSQLNSFRSLFAITTSNYIKGMEHVQNIFMSFDKYLFLEVINILI